MAKMYAFRLSISRRFYSLMSSALCFIPASKTPVTKTMNSAKIMLIKAPVPAPYTIFQHSFWLTFRKRVSQAYCFYFKRLRGTHTPCLST